MAGKHRRQKRPEYRRRRKWPYILLLLIVVGGVGSYLFITYGYKKTAAKPLASLKNSPLKIPKKPVYCPLDGREVSSEHLIQRRPIIVKVENLSDARPQSGLDKACIVYEAMAEGGITRFAAVYLCQDADEIGPVRSARLHDIDLVREYDALLVHVGSSDAYAVEAGRDIASLDEFAYTSSYWRSKDRAAPHNVYTSTKKLRDTATKEGLEREVALRGFTFKKDEPGKGKVASLYIPYPADCDTLYEYDARSNTFLRTVNGEPHEDKVTGARLAAKNVIVQYVSYTYSSFGEEYGMGGRQTMNLVGEGRAQIFRDGEVIEAMWSKVSPSQPTNYTDTAGNPIIFNRGQIWVEYVPDNWEIEITQNP